MGAFAPQRSGCQASPAAYLLLFVSCLLGCHGHALLTDYMAMQADMLLYMSSSQSAVHGQPLSCLLQSFVTAAVLTALVSRSTACQPPAWPCSHIADAALLKVGASCHDAAANCFSGAGC